VSISDSNILEWSKVDSMKSRLCISLGCVQYHWGCQLFESKYLLKGLCNVTEELQEHEYSSVVFFYTCISQHLKLPPWLALQMIAEIADWIADGFRWLILLVMELSVQNLEGGLLGCWFHKSFKVSFWGNSQQLEQVQMKVLTLFFLVPDTVPSLVDSLFWTCNRSVFFLVPDTVPSLVDLLFWTCNHSVYTGMSVHATSCWSVWAPATPIPCGQPFILCFHKKWRVTFLAVFFLQNYWCSLLCFQEKALILALTENAFHSIWIYCFL
jgi:hypothetical protein